MLKLAGKVAIVTASTDGIGFAIAKRLLKDGAKVVISSRREINVKNALNKLSDLGCVIGVRCHVSKEDERKRLFETAIEHFHKLDILVSNAAANPVFSPIIECSENSWDKIFEINVKASFLLAKEAFPFLQKNETGGNIIFISSVAGYQPITNLGPYSVSKTALFGLTKALASDLASDKIRVNCIAPGIIKTKFSSPFYKNHEILDRVLTEIPLNRLGEPDEIGSIVSFLVSDDASYITGETIAATGGMKSRL